MDASNLMPMLMKFTGMTQADIDKVTTAGLHRLQDAKALTLGGVMSDGNRVPGMNAVYGAMKATADGYVAMAAQQRALTEEVKRLAIALEKMGGKTGGNDVETQQEKAGGK